MSHTRTEATIRDDITQAEALYERLVLQVADMDTRRAEAEAERKRAARRAETLRAELRDVLDEPTARATLDDLVTRLRARLAQPFEYPNDARSVTRKAVAHELDRATGDARLSTNEKAKKVRQLALDFAERRTLDAQAWRVSK